MTSACAFRSNPIIDKKARTMRENPILGAVPNTALREIGGRIQMLTFSELEAFSKIFESEAKKPGLRRSTSQKLMDVAKQLGSA